MSRLLIVDDEQSYCENLQFLFSRLGHEVRTAGTGESGLAIGVQFRPHVLIVDLMLKDSYSGGEVASALRSLDPQLRVAAITGFVDPGAVARNLDVFDHILQKPFRSALLVQAVEEMLADAGDRFQLQD